MNRVFLSGRITNDPEVRWTQSNLAVCSFTLAVDRPKRKGQDKPEADFIRCQAWQNTAEYIGKYVHKGDKLFLYDCRIQTGKYVDKEGRTVWTTDVIVGSVDYVVRKAANDVDQGKAEPELADFEEINGNEDMPY